MWFVLKVSVIISYFNFITRFIPLHVWYSCDHKETLVMFKGALATRFKTKYDFLFSVITEMEIVKF